MSTSCKKLNFGDTISVISPSSQTHTDEINNYLKKVAYLGFKCKTYDHFDDSYMGYLAGKDKDRASDFNKALKDKDTNAIISIRGGYGSLRMIDYIDWFSFHKNPKIFMGFSDLTPILNYIYKKFNVISFHAPMLVSNFKNDFSKDSLINSITSIKECYNILNPETLPLKSFYSKESIAYGNIVGGNLSLICSTIGTKYEPVFEKNILFIEEVGEAPYRVDRMLTHLYLTGKINKCSGIIFGQFTNCINNHDSATIEEVIYEKFKLFNKPCIYNLYSGHCDPNITIPIGAKAMIDCKNISIKILEKVVS